MVTVMFPESQFSSVELPQDAKLSEVLNVSNSPVLFGCRTGVCGTCLVEVDEVTLVKLPPQNETEKELLAIICPENPRARLACQLSASTDLNMKYIG